MKAPMLTVEQAAARVGCHPQALRRLMGEGRCPGAKIAGRWRIDADALEAWLVAQRVPERSEVDRFIQQASACSVPEHPDNPFV